MDFFLETNENYPKEDVNAIMQRLKGTADSVLFAFDAISNFNIIPSQEFLEEAKSLKSSFKSLNKEFVWEYWKSWSVSRYPSEGLKFLQESEWLENFPELFGMVGVLQNKDTHPEGDVFNHTLLTVDEASKIRVRENLNERDSLTLMFSALCHDLGKQEGLNNHEVSGVNLSYRFLRAIGADEDTIFFVKKLVYYHMADYKVGDVFVRDEDINEDYVSNLVQMIYPIPFELLYFLHESDKAGRLNVAFSDRISNNFKKIFLIYQGGFSKFTIFDILKMTADGLIPDHLSLHGDHQDLFIKNVNKAMELNYLSKEEKHPLVGFLFSDSYIESLNFVNSLDYREKSKLVKYLNSSGSDLDTVLLKGKLGIESILNTPSN